MKPIKTWDEAQSEIQKQMGEIIKAVWNAGVKFEREKIINLFERYDVYMQADVIASGMFDIVKKLKEEMENDQAISK